MGDVAPPQRTNRKRNYSVRIRAAVARTQPASLKTSTAGVTKLKRQHNRLLSSLGGINHGLAPLGVFASKLSDKLRGLEVTVSVFERTMYCFLCGLLDMDSDPIDNNSESFEDLRCKVQSIYENFPTKLTARQLFLLHRVESWMAPKTNTVSLALETLSSMIRQSLSDEVCAICLLELDSSIVVPKCNHAIHANCFIGLCFKDTGPHNGKCRSCLQSFQWGNMLVRGNLMSLVWTVVDRTLLTMDANDVSEQDLIPCLVNRVAVETGTTYDQVLAESARHVELRQQRRQDAQARAKKEKTAMRRLSCVQAMRLNPT